MALITATAALTVARRNGWLDHILGNTPDTPPSSVYVMLLDAAPDDSGTFSEVAGTTRQAASFAQAATRTAVTDADITFTAVPAGDVAWIGLIDDPTAGTLIGAGPVTGGPVDPAGDDLLIAAGDLAMTVAYGSTSGMSEPLAAAMLNHQLRSETYVPATTPEVALFNSSDTELSGGSYARDAVTWAAAAAGLAATDSQADWANLPADTVASLRLFEDAASGGLHAWTWEITPKAFTAGAVARVNVGALTCTAA